MGIVNNELILLQELLTEIEYPGTITLDMRKTAKHWFLGYDYYLIRMETLANDISKETCIADSYYGSQINDLFIDRANHNIEKSIKRYWSNEVEIGTIDVIAFTDKIVEKDSAIFYLYNLEGDNLGLYCHSMNWVEDIVYIGRSRDSKKLRYTKKPRSFP